MLKTNDNVVIIGYSEQTINNVIMKDLSHIISGYLFKLLF